MAEGGVYRFLGIDYGLERTGLAVSDPSGQVVFPLATCRLGDYGSRRALLDGIAAYAAAAKVQGVVLGLPLYACGSESLMSRQVRNVAQRLKRRIPGPFYFMPEFLSSQEAYADLRQAGIKADKIAEILDQQAACRILQSFLAQDREKWLQV